MRAMDTQLLRRACVLLGAGLAVAFSHAPARAASIPTYKASPCCSLCPRAADPDVYVTRFMTGNRLTIQGTDDWLFRTEVDLDTQFTLDEAVYAGLARMVQSLNARGTQVLLLDLPRRGRHTPLRRV